MENQNQQEPSEVQFEPEKHHWHESHRFLWWVVACLLFIVVTATAFWWQEIKQVTVNSNQETGTLVGVDTDNNGVWDYVDKYITDTYPDSPQIRAALKQLAKINQQFILAADDTSKVFKVVEQRHAAQQCLYYVNGGDINKAADMRVGLRSMLLNTPERTAAYMKADAQLSGSSGTASDPKKWKEACNFDPDSITEISDWKTYTNTEYGFEFKYPSNWTVANIKTDNAGIIWVNFASISSGSSKNTLYVKIFPDQKSYSAEEKLISSNASATVIKVDGVQANYYGNFLDIPTALISNNSLFLEIGNPLNGADLTQILSTFKFTDKTAADVSTWKTYTNTEYGFEFQYPSNLSLGPNISASPKEFGTDLWIGEPSVKWQYGVSAQYNNKNQTLEEVFQNKYDEIKSAGGGKQFKSNDFSISSLKVSNLGAKLLLINYSELSTGRQVYILNNGYIYTISTSNSKEDFDKFLSTIKFSKSQRIPVQYDTSISNWKTYSDAGYGFEIKYPSSWLINKVGTDLIIFYAPIYTSSDPENPIKIHIIDNSKNFSIIEWFKNYLPQDMVYNQSIPLGNKAAIQTKISEPVLSQTPLLLFNNKYVESNGHVYSIGTPDNSAYWNIYTLMLSTFKFTK